jgi:hypothetical protein
VHEWPQLASHASHHDPFIHVPVTRKDKEEERKKKRKKEETKKNIRILELLET